MSPIPTKRHLACGIGSMLACSVLIVVPAAAALADATYNETTGGVTHTWTNYANAGGSEGPTIAAFSTVQIACAITGFRVADGNTWWYRIAQSPWNNTYYASADAFYNNGQTSGSLHGTPFVDPAVPNCSAPPPPPPPPPPSSPVVTLAQGPTAQFGYRYAITLQDFPANASIAVNCYDSKSPSGFFPFTMHTDGSGHAFTQSQCYSGDGPDHWAVANGVESNHVTWGGSAGSNPGGGGQPAGGGTQSGSNQNGSGTSATSPKSTGPVSVFYSGTNSANGSSASAVADLNFGYDKWRGACKPDNAIHFDGDNVSTLAGWSKGRLGPVYFLSAAGSSRTANVHTIIFFDPGAASEMSGMSFWDKFVHNKPCDLRYDINGLLANWLKSNTFNRLIIIAGRATEDKDSGHDFGGIWTYYIAGIWRQTFANRAIICDYDNMEHNETLSRFASIVKSPPPSCPPGPSLTQWHP